MNLPKNIEEYRFLCRQPSLSLSIYCPSGYAYIPLVVFDGLGMLIDGCLLEEILFVPGEWFKSSFVHAEDKLKHQDSGPLNTTPDPDANHIDLERPQLSPADAEISELPGVAAQVGVASSEPWDAPVVSNLDMSGEVETIKRLFIKQTEGYLIPQLERLYTKVLKGVFETRNGVQDNLTLLILCFLSRFAEDKANFES